MMLQSQDFQNNFREQKIEDTVTFEIKLSGKPPQPTKGINPLLLIGLGVVVVALVVMD